MPFTIEPINAEEANQNKNAPWDNGEYDFIINSAVEGKSRNGNDQIKLQMTIYDGTKQKNHNHWLTFTPNTKAIIRSFYSALGLIEKYESGIIDANDLVGANGYCFLGKQDPDENGNVYNTIKYFIESDEKPDQRPAKKSEAVELEEIDEDDIPF